MKTRLTVILIIIISMCLFSCAAFKKSSKKPIEGEEIKGEVKKEGTKIEPENKIEAISVEEVEENLPFYISIIDESFLETISPKDSITFSLKFGNSTNDTMRNVKLVYNNSELPTYITLKNITMDSTFDLFPQSKQTIVYQLIVGKGALINDEFELKFQLFTDDEIELSHKLLKIKVTEAATGKKDEGRRRLPHREPIPPGDD